MGYSFKILAFLLLSNILSISTASTPTIEPDCGSCSKPPVIPVVPLPPVTIPTVPVPPVTVPTVPVVGVIPKLPLPPVIVTVPPVTVPTVPVVGVIPTVPLPPVIVTVPPVIIPTVPVVGVVPLPLPPVVVTTPEKGKPCEPPAHKIKKVTCPLNTLKLGACAGVLGGTVSVVAGFPAAKKCCPIISGLADAEAAACLCTTLKINALNLKIFVPVALQLLVTCGKTPPPGYTCPV